MNLQEQIKNLKVGDSVRVHGIGVLDQRPYSFAGQKVHVNAVRLKIRGIDGIEVRHLGDFVLMPHSAIVEVIPAKAECQHAWHFVTSVQRVCTECGLVGEKPLPVCGYCKTRCSSKSSDEVGSKCFLSQYFKRQDEGWKSGSRGISRDKRQNTEFILRPGMKGAAFGYANGGSLFTGEYVDILTNLPSFGVVSIKWNDIILNIHEKNIVPIERRKPNNDRRKFWAKNEISIT